MAVTIEKVENNRILVRFPYSNDLVDKSHLGMSSRPHPETATEQAGVP
jgi:hypothetical protein